MSLAKETLGPEESMMKERLQKALKQVAQLYVGDADLVRPGAELHHVQVTEGDMFTPPELGNYNARIPTGAEDEAEQLTRIQSITVMCEDYRQSGQVVSSLELNIAPGKDAIFASAGGAAQPDAARQAAAVELITAIHALNPKVEIRLCAHTNVCGGANYYTNGEAKAKRLEGVDAEEQFMHGFEVQMQNALVAAGVPQENISLYISNVDEDNSFAGLERK